MKRLIALAAMLVISACSAGNPTPSDGLLIRVDFSTPAWQDDGWLLQVVSADMGIKRNVYFDPTSRLILINYTQGCNWDGHGAGGACVQETVAPYEVGRWYRFDKQPPALMVRAMGANRYEIVTPAGWRCPICKMRGVEMMPMNQ